MIELTPVAAEEAQLVRAMAEDIWWKVYPAMLSPEQIRYMLDWMYEPEQLRCEIGAGRVRYHWIRHAGTNIGYCAVEPGDEPGEAHVHKFYLVAERHGCGLGSVALQALIREERSRRATCLTLRVNRHNHPALRCYLRNGFTVVCDIRTEIGGGFVMDDHWMRLEIGGHGGIASGP